MFSNIPQFGMGMRGIFVLDPQQAKRDQRPTVSTETQIYMGVPVRLALRKAGHAFSSSGNVSPDSSGRRPEV